MIKVKRKKNRVVVESCDYRGEIERCAFKDYAAIKDAQDIAHRLRSALQRGVLEVFDNYTDSKWFPHTARVYPGSYNGW